MKKYLLYIFLLIILVGFFSPILKVHAQATSPETKYNLLEPLPCEKGTAGCDENGKLTSFDPGGTGKLGEYLNFAIRLFIGLCAVAAVIMIVIGGIEYSTSELISTKAAAKERIQGAIFGLLLALCSWLILYTVNPDLLNTEVDIGNATLTSEGELEVVDLREIPPDSAPIPAGRSGTCVSGIERTRSGIYACKDIAQNLDAMIDAAKAAGLNITGGGFRTLQEQINKRIQNCGGDIYGRPANQCHPPTAKPGTSRHESGLAVDFNCNGATIRSRSNACFIWLQNNAGRFGYYNLPSEPWHWSRDGR